MKRFYTFLVSMFIGLLLLGDVFAQSPEKMSYQAVIRDAGNKLVANKTVSVRINIIQGSIYGASVFVETHSVMTNINGLAKFEIGEGTLEYGNFSGIDWSSGPYFLKTETDPYGGTNYTITGTSQLLSVPYAFYAKTAEKVTGTITETDPVFSSSPSKSITAIDINNLDNLSGVNTGDQDISGIEANTQAIQDTAAQIRSDIPSVIKYSVGDFAQGGIVIWMDETGQHGLVCAKEDQSTSVRWYAGTYGNTRAKGDNLFAGKANTSIIIAAQVAIGDDGNTYAAHLCNELQVTEDGKTYGDWYLPSKEELNLMYQNIATINATAKKNGGSAFTGTGYWSSTEVSSNNAWMQVFTDAGRYVQGSKSALGSVRAVRAF
jgi:hypothetical protein